MSGYTSVETKGQSNVKCLSRKFLTEHTFALRVDRRLTAADPPAVPSVAVDILLRFSQPNSGQYFSSQRSELVAQKCSGSSIQCVFGCFDHPKAGAKVPELGPKTPFVT